MCRTTQGTSGRPCRVQSPRLALLAAGVGRSKHPRLGKCGRISSANPSHAALPRNLSTLLTRPETPTSCPTLPDLAHEHTVHRSPEKHEYERKLVNKFTPAGHGNGFLYPSLARPGNASWKDPYLWEHPLYAQHCHVLGTTGCRKSVTSSRHTMH